MYSYFRLMDQLSFDSGDFSESCRQLLSCSRLNDIVIITFITIVGIVIYNICNEDRKIRIFDGFGISIAVIIFTLVVRSIFLGLEQDLNTVCDTNSINPNNKLSVVLTFVYYYLKTFAIFICKSLFIFLIVYIVFTSIKCLVFFETSDIPLGGFLDLKHMKIHKKVVLYIVLAFISAIFYYLIYDNIKYEMKLFFKPTAVKDYDPIKSKLSFTTFILVCILIIVPFNVFSYWITKGFGIIFRHLNMHDALSHTKMFNFIDKKYINIHLTVFIQGLIMSIVYAIVMIPTVDLNGYCSRNINNCPCSINVAKQQQDFEMFGNRFRVGYYIIMVLVVFLYIGYALKKEIDNS